MKLEGKKAILTGGSKGIGREIATTFAKEGADLLISYRSDKEGAEKTVHMIQQVGRKAKAIHADFSTSENIRTFFSEAIEFLDEVDLLVNNAAGYDTKGFFDLGVETFNECFQLGVSAPMLLIQLTAEKMVEKNIAGSIVNISSISGIRPFPNRVAHSAAKAALNMLTQSTALELANHHIRVNALAPGPVPYEPMDKPIDIPLGRFGTVEDQAKATLFLASDDSSWMTGQVLVVDGGRSLSL